MEPNFPNVLFLHTITTFNNFILGLLAFLIPIYIGLTIYTSTDDHVTKLPSICSHLVWNYDNTTNIFQASFKVKDATTEARGWVAGGMRITYANGDQDITIPMVIAYNLSEYEGSIVKSSFKLDVSPLDVKLDTIYHIWGHLFTSHRPTMKDLEQSNGMSYGVLHLNNPRNKSTILIERLSRILTFEKGCTLGRKPIWTDHFTLHNIGAVLINLWILAFVFIAPFII